MGGLIDIHVRLSKHDLVVAQVANEADRALPSVGETMHAGWSADSAGVPGGEAGEVTPVFPIPPPVMPAKAGIHDFLPPYRGA